MILWGGDDPKATKRHVEAAVNAVAIAVIASAILALMAQAWDAQEAMSLERARPQIERVREATR